MINCIKGNSGALLEYCQTTYTSNKDIIITSSDECALPYTLFRKLIPVFQEKLGASKVDQILRKHRLYMSLIFDGLKEELSTIEIRKLSVMGAQLESNVTHTRVKERYLTEACVSILWELLEEQDFNLVIPNICFLDQSSVYIIMKLYEREYDTLPDLVLGYDPDLEGEFEEVTGISWFYSLNRIHCQAFFAAFEENATQTYNLEKSVVSNFKKQDLEQVYAQKHRWDKQLELEGFNLVRQSFDSEDPAISSKIYNSVIKNFNLYNFSGALRLGQRFLATNPVLDDDKKAELHTMVGVCAHNLHFFSQGNMVLADYILENYRIAIELEKDPARRICLLYRLIVVLARRKGDIAAAEVYLKMALEELSLNGFNSNNEKQMVQSWISNIHSFVLMRKRLPQKAIEVHSKAFHDLGRITNKGLLKFEIEFSSAVLAENLCTLNTMIENYEEAKIWYEREEEIVKQWPDVSITSYAEWQSYYFKTLQMDKALEEAKKGWEATKKKYKYILHYFFTMSLADINSRLGNPDEALKYYERSLICESKIDYRYTSMLSLRKGNALALYENGDYESFVSEIEKLLEQFKNETVFNKVDLWALKAFGHAKLGVFEEANNSINKGVELALDDGAANTILHILIYAGITSLHLQNPDEAQQAFRQAYEVYSDTNPDSVSHTDISLLFLGLLKTHQNTIQKSQLEFMISSLYKALKEDAYIWNYLSSFLELIEEHIDSIDISSDGFKSILKAASQRADTKEKANQLIKAGMIIND
ncbi:tetratricopeptide repeat protein [Flavobacteriaceae bacterium M23B6Z8]